MKKQFIKTLEDVLRTDEKAVLLLGDIGVFGFRNLIKELPDRCYNIGILEQSSIGLAAGLAMQGFIPTFHTIAPFIVERGLEQIKDDFGYQKLGGNFISVGASYDYVALGATHHCPGDVGILKNVPEVEIVVPGTPMEFDSLFRQSYADGHPTYFRLGEKSNTESSKVMFGKANIIRKGTRATVIAVGPMLEKVKEACKDMDVTILYYTTLQPFDHDALRENIHGDKVIVCEPYYSGACATDISIAVGSRPVEVAYIGVPREFVHHYGTVEEIDALFHLTVEDIKSRIKAIIS